MESTNNPEAGTGLTVAEAATHIENLMDSPKATIREEVDADSEFEDSQTLEDEDEDEVAEQSDEDSEEVEGETDSETTDDAKDAVETILKDDVLVDVNGQKLPLKELRDGYLRRADYTVKTQELKQRMGQYALQQHDLNDIRSAVGNEINTLKQRISTEFKFNEPDWDYLAREEPAQYIAEKREWDKKVAAVKEIHDLEQLTIAQNAKYREEAILNAKRDAYEQLAEKYPAEFSDYTKGEKLLGEVGGWLVYEMGFSADEVQGIADSRIIDVAYRAMKQEALSNRVPQVVKKMQNKPALTMPGSVTGKTSVRDQAFEKDRQKLKQSGSVNDAASLISKYL